MDKGEGVSRYMLCFFSADTFHGYGSDSIHCAIVLKDVSYFEETMYMYSTCMYIIHLHLHLHVYHTSTSTSTCTYTVTLSYFNEGGACYSAMYKLRVVFSIHTQKWKLTENGCTIYDHGRLVT